MLLRRHLGTVGEEIAVELMQAGADDYVMKDRLTRLATAVRRALERAAERRALRRAEDALRRSYEDLEHRVEERTAELQVANDELRAQQQALAAASDALSVARDRYQDLFDSAPVAYLVTGGEGTIRSANRAARELLGHAHVSPATRDLGAYVSPASIGAYRNALKHGGRDGAPQRCELRLRPAGSEGRERLVACTAAAEGTAHGGEGLLRWVLHDVTEERELEERLATSARFPSENPDPVLRVDRDGTLLYANTASAGLLEKWGAHVGRRLPEEWRQAVQAALEQGAMGDGGRGRRHDLRPHPRPAPGQGYVNIYGGDVTERVKATTDTPPAGARRDQPCSSGRSRARPPTSCGAPAYWSPWSSPRARAACSAR